MSHLPSISTHFYPLLKNGWGKKIWSKILCFFHQKSQKDEFFNFHRQYKIFFVAFMPSNHFGFIFFVPRQVSKLFTKSKNFCETLSWHEGLTLEFGVWKKCVSPLEQRGSLLQWEPLFFSISEKKKNILLGTNLLVFPDENSRFFFHKRENKTEHFCR